MSGGRLESVAMEGKGTHVFSDNFWISMHSLLQRNVVSGYFPSILRCSCCLHLRKILFVNPFLSFFLFSFASPFRSLPMSPSMSLMHKEKVPVCLRKILAQWKTPPPNNNMPSAVLKVADDVIQGYHLSQ